MKPLIPFVYSNLPVFLAAIVLAGISFFFSGCYTLKQGAAMISYLGRAVPLEKLSQGLDVPDEDLQFVQRVENIRRFAMDELGLSSSRNYTSYVDMDRDFLVAVVTAYADDSFTRHQWWFPVVGRVPYKGFFNVEDARKERNRLEKRNLDVWIGRVDAFSTLGWFRDPLYSFMRNYSERYLADLIIHELMHATVWIKGHAQFNEELAQFVGIQGARLYMERMLGDCANETDAEHAAALEDRVIYHAFIRDLIAELDVVYKSDVSREEKLIRKEEFIERAKIRFNESYDELFKTDNYRNISELPINNAFLGLFLLYHEEDQFFNDLYNRSGSDLKKIIAAARTLNTRPGRGYNPKLELERALGLHSLVPSDHFEVVRP